MSGAVLSVRDLTVDYDSGRRQGRAVDGLSFDIAPGEALALVGESGCGKTTTALAMLRLLPQSTEIGGQIRFGGEDIATLDENRLRALRGNQIGMIFQEPMTSLNPVHRIGDQIAEVLRMHSDLDRRARRARVLELLEQVAIPEPQRRINAYPHELSGGQRQRVVIAMAIAMRPRLLIADEPTTALDSTIQLQILELLDRLRRDLGMALLLISHDLPVVARWTDRVMVMHHGVALEQLPAADLFARGAHPYTRGLISASIRLDAATHYTRGRLTEIRALPDGTGGLRFDLHRPVPAAAARPAPATAAPLLTVEAVTIAYDRHRKAVDDLSLSIAQGETLGLVGESGCGKSTLSRAILGLVRPTAGQIRLGDEAITGATPARLRALRRRVQMVFQDPFASLNPRQRVEDILGGLLRLHGESDRIARQRRVAACLDQVGLPAGAATRFAHEFSGGQRQRIGIARALILRPDLVVLDEPVSALDVSIQAQILNLLSDLRDELGLSYLFISHDLAVVQYVSDRVAVMQAGRIVEQGAADQLWRNPGHPQTRRLIEAAL